MTKNRIVKYAANTALLAVLAAAGIGVYQLGTAPSDEKIIQDKNAPQTVEENMEEEPLVDAGTSQVEADLENAGEGNLAGNDIAETEDTTVDEPDFQENGSEETTAQKTDTDAEDVGDTAETGMEETTDVSAEAASLPELSFSEDTLMQWPVNGNILLDYNMDQTTYFPTLDQYKLSPAIAVQAVEGAR